MEDAKLQQLHDTLAKIRGTGKKGLGRHGGSSANTKSNQNPSANALYAHFVPEGTYQPDAHIKRDFSSDDEETKDVVQLDSKTDRKAAKKLAKKEEKKRKKQEAKQQAKKEAKRLSKASETVANPEPSTSSRKEKKKAKSEKKESKKRKLSDDDKIHQPAGESSGPNANDEKQKSKKAKKKKRGDKGN